MSDFLDDVSQEQLTELFSPAQQRLRKLEEYYKKKGWYLDDISIKHALAEPKLPKPQQVHVYFPTFTWNEKVSKDKWLDRVYLEMSRKIILSFVGVFEHMDSNMHFHARIETERKHTVDRFSTFAKGYGIVLWPTKVKDNGIEQYMEKENVPVRTLDELKSQIDIYKNGQVQQEECQEGSVA